MTSTWHPNPDLSCKLVMLTEEVNNPCSRFVQTESVRLLCNTCWGSCEHGASENLTEATKRACSICNEHGSLWKLSILKWQWMHFIAARDQMCAGCSAPHVQIGALEPLIACLQRDGLCKDGKDSIPWQACFFLSPQMITHSSVS